MPSVPTHFVVGAALGQGAGRRARTEWKFWILALVCSALPDVDVLGFHFGIRYGDLWGHRGMTHSILFAVVAGLVAGMLYGGAWAERVGDSIVLIAVTASHGLLDAMTNGGLGVAFFSPFDRTRYFLPWRPILVSPIGLDRFLSSRGLSVLMNEIVIVWLPMMLLGVVLHLIRRIIENRAARVVK